MHDHHVAGSPGSAPSGAAHSKYATSRRMPALTRAGPGTIDITHNCDDGRVIIAGRSPISVRLSSRDQASSITGRSRVSPVPAVFAVVDPGDHDDPFGHWIASAFNRYRTRIWDFSGEANSRFTCTSSHFSRALLAVCVVYNTRWPGPNPMHRCVITGINRWVFPVTCRGPTTITVPYAGSPVSGSISRATSAMSC